MDIRDPTRKVFFTPGQRKYLRGTIAKRNLNIIASTVVVWSAVIIGVSVYRKKETPQLSKLLEYTAKRRVPVQLREKEEEPAPSAEKDLKAIREFGKSVKELVVEDWEQLLHVLELGRHFVQELLKKTTAGGSAS